MADEITINLNMRAANGLFKFQPAPVNVSVDQTTAGGGGPGQVTVGTSEETISFGDTVPGLVMMQNLDTTNFVSYGTVTGNLDFTLSADNEPQLVRLKTTESLIMQADTASCKVMIQALDE